jgi:26S proteasome regulatory subunit N13
MLPGDGTFSPLISSQARTSPTNGRIFVLKFSSSSSRHFFWLQSKNQHPDNKPNWYSDRDLKLGSIVNDLLQGAEVDVEAELAAVSRGPAGNDGNDDEDMQDAPPTDNSLRRTSTGGAGADATGGDVREEGEEAREGGADGGRA